MKYIYNNVLKSKYFLKNAPLHWEKDYQGLELDLKQMGQPKTSKSYKKFDLWKQGDV